MIIAKIEYPKSGSVCPECFDIINGMHGCTADSRRERKRKGARMGRRIVKLGDKFFEWSTIVDAPVTNGLTREQMIKHLIEDAKAEAEQRLRNAENARNMADDAEDISKYNRAGPDETTATIEYIVATYSEKERGEG